MKWTTAAGTLATCVVDRRCYARRAARRWRTPRTATPTSPGRASRPTIDCNDSTLIVNGTSNIVTAKGTCWAVTIMGSSNMVIADTVINDITVYGYDGTVFFHNGDPVIWDRGRELGMTNRIQRVGP